LAINPNNKVVLGYKGLYLSELGRDEEALKLFDKAIYLDPDKYSNKYHPNVVGYALLHFKVTVDEIDGLVHTIK
jgi:tetratricopeptide (TPR) repeat protein